jgi:hypothetical protein
MGMAADQSTFQLVATCCTDREEDHLHAWWNWKVNQSCTANRSFATPHNNGGRLCCAHGPPMVKILLLVLLYVSIEGAIICEERSVMGVPILSVLYLLAMC